MAKRKPATVGQKIEAKRLGCKPHELSGGNLDDARCIDRAIEEEVQGSQIAVKALAAELAFYRRNWELLEEMIRSIGGRLELSKLAILQMDVDRSEIASKALREEGVA